MASKIARSVWEYVHAHPEGVSSMEVSKALGLSQSNVSSYLAVMVRGKQIDRRKVRFINDKARAQTIYHYSTTSKSFDKRKVFSVRTQEAALVSPPPVTVGRIESGSGTTTIRVDQLKTMEAYALYKELHKLFGGANV